MQSGTAMLSLVSSYHAGLPPPSVIAITIQDNSPSNVTNLSFGVIPPNDRRDAVQLLSTNLRAGDTRVGMLTLFAADPRRRARRRSKQTPHCVGASTSRANGKPPNPDPVTHDPLHPSLSHGLGVGPALAGVGTGPPSG